LAAGEQWGAISPLLPGLAISGATWQRSRGAPGTIPWWTRRSPSIGRGSFCRRRHLLALTCPFRNLSPPRRLEAWRRRMPGHREWQGEEDNQDQADDHLRFSHPAAHLFTLSKIPPPHCTPIRSDHPGIITPELIFPNQHSRSSDGTDPASRSLPQLQGHPSQVSHGQVSHGQVSHGRASVAQFSRIP